MSGGAAPSASELLTFLIADVRGYTAYTQARGDEAAAHLAATFAEVMREGVEAWGGRVIELRGDEALAVFTSARAALRAAVDTQAALVDEVERHPAIPLRVGMGLDAGEAVPVEDGYRGGALNLAARLCSKAGPGEILASQGVIHLARAVDGIHVEEGETLDLKGLERPVPALRISGGPGDGLAERLDRAAARGEIDERRTTVPPALAVSTPIATGREVVARRLRWAWRTARRGEGGAFLILGGAGMGKTRLAAEVAELAARDGARVVHVTGSTGAAEIPTAAEGAELVVLDDLDLGDPAARDGAVTAVRDAAGRPRLVVVTSSDGSPLASDLAIGADRVIRLEPLSVEAVAEILTLHAGREVETAPVAAVLEASGGVPARVHHLASEWVRGEAARRLGEATARAAAGRSDLRAAEADVASNVIDLQLARERAELFGDEHARIARDGTRTSPFKGLASFEVEDADVFFGRERLVAEMLGRLAGATLLGVVGPSGSGKSSAARAGLLAALAAGSLPGSEGWIRIVLRPGAYPLRALDRAMWSGIPDRLRQALEGAELPLRAIRDHLGEGQRVVVLVDQFEELFTQCEDEDDRRAFVNAVGEAATDARGNVVVIAAIRADFYGHCAAYPELAELVGASHVLVGPMTGQEYRRAIGEPARRSGLVVEPELTDALVAEVLHEPGALPLLSTALLELWQRREGRMIPLAAYRVTGGVNGAVGRLAEAAFERLDDRERDVARAVMLRLAGAGEGDAIARRRAPLEEFDTERDPRVATVLRVFTEARLLTVSEGAVEVAHEALLREWTRLKDWLEEDREGLRLHAHLTQAAHAWDEEGRDQGELYRGARLASALDWTTGHSLEINELERAFVTESRAASERETQRQRRQNRRLRGLLVGAVVLMVVALVAGGLAAAQRGKAERSATAATAARLGAQAVIVGDLDTSLLLAAQARAIDDSKDTRSTLLASLLKAPAAIRILPGTGGRVLEMHGSDDGTIFASTDNIGGMAVYDAAEMRLLRTVEVPTLGGFDVSPDGSYILGEDFGNEFPGIARIDTATGEMTAEPLPEGSTPSGSGVSFAPDGASFVMIEAREEPVIVRRTSDDFRELASAPISFEGDRPLVMFMPDGERVVVDGGGSLLVLDAETLRVERAIRDEFFAFGVSSDGRTVGFGRTDGSVAFADIITGEIREAEGRHGASVQGAGFAPDGRTFVTTSDDREVIVWDAESASLVEVMSGHSGRAFGPVFDADGSTAFTAGLDGRGVIAWDLTSARRIGQRVTFATPEELCCSDVFGVDWVAAGDREGERFATATLDGRVRVTDPSTGEIAWEADPWSAEREDELRDLEPIAPDFVTPSMLTLEFSPDGSSLAVGGGTREVVVYDAGTGEERLRLLATELGWVNDVSFMPDGRLVTANDDGRVVIWDGGSATPASEYRILPQATSTEDYPGATLRAVPSPDGSLIAVETIGVGYFDARLRMVDVESGEEIWEEKADPFGGEPGWSADSDTVGFGGRQSGALTIRDARTGERVGQPVPASAGFVVSVDFSPSLSVWVTTGSDGTVRLFDAETRQQVGTTIVADDGQWAYVTVTDGGAEMVVTSMAGHVWRWDLDPSRWSEQACQVADRSLTEDEWATFLGDRPYEPTCAA